MTEFAALNSSLAEDIASLLRKIEYFRVETAAEKQAVYRLRYDCYRREGAIASRSQKVLTDDFDECEDVFVFGLKIKNRLAGSIRLHILSDGQQASPTAQSFADIVAPLLAAGQIVIDPTRFVVDPDVRSLHPNLAYAILRLPFLAASHFAADTALAAVCREHMAFYARVLRYSKVSDPRQYLQLTKPLGLMMANYSREKDAVLKRYPFFSARPGEVEGLFGSAVPNGARHICLRAQDNSCGAPDRPMGGRASADNKRVSSSEAMNPGNRREG